MTVDVLIVGGGLAGSLAAWRLAVARPELDVHVIEQGETLGGNHTWSFHDTDLGAESLAWIAPVITARWPTHEVAFPGMRRVLPGGYASIASTQLHDVLAPVLAPRVRFGRSVAELAPSQVTLDSGTTIRARVVIDARGYLPASVPLGWQTFLGQQLVCDADHGVEVPMLMDATGPQAGGFRFVYVLPFDRRTLLVEDTCYRDDPVIDAEQSRRAISEYTSQHGWRVARIEREETGVLPLPLGGKAEAFWPDDQPRIGMRAGLFHPTTGYSLPDAVAVADLLVSLDLSRPVAVAQALRAFATERWAERSFFRLLNRLLFRAARPEERVRVLAHFYGRSEDLIARFYAARLTGFDRLRILSGRPPVSVFRALANLRA